jgi:hypothetical protein
MNGILAEDKGGERSLEGGEVIGIIKLVVCQMCILHTVAS